jgi:hypothetical protein
MNAAFLLFALNAGDVIEFLVIIVIVVITVIGQLAAKMRQPRPPIGPQPPAGPRPPQQRPQTPKSVKEEIEQFIRRATQQAETSGKSPRQAAPPRQLAPARQVAQPRKVAPLPSSAPAKSQQPIKAQVVRERPVGGQVSEHVRKYLDEKEFAQRASSLGGEVAQADDKIEQHLRNVFEHKISHLAGRSGETAIAPAPLPTGFFQDEVPAVSAAAGVGLAALLNNIDNLRQAIVLNEILQRPIDRWQ